MVLATQNPIESEGTYPLPEAQLDRFLFKVEIGYPELAGEVAVVIRSTSNQAGNELPLSEVKPVLNERAVLSLQQIAGHQRVDDQVVDYAVRIVRATRETAGLALGAGSRGAISLVRGARAVALMDGRNYVTPDDIKKVALPCLRHRIALAPDALLEGRKPNELLAGIIETTAAPADVRARNAAVRLRVIPGRVALVLVAIAAAAGLAALVSERVAARSVAQLTARCGAAC